MTHLDDDVLHIRVGDALRDQMRALIARGVYPTQTEIVREGIRDLLLRYPPPRQTRTP